MESMCGIIMTRSLVSYYPIRVISYYVSTPMSLFPEHNTRPVRVAGESTKLSTGWSEMCSASVFHSGESGHASLIFIRRQGIYNLFSTPGVFQD